MIKYPTGDVTPHGQYFDAQGRYPTVHLLSHDKSVEFYLMGGRSIAWPDQPECVRLLKDGIKGLIAPWKIIGQKGASQDGETFIDSLYDPAEPELSVVVHGRSPRYLQEVYRRFVYSIDTIRTATLSVEDVFEDSTWQAPIRWNKVPADPFPFGEHRSVKMTTRLRIDDGLWTGDPTIVQLAAGGGSVTVTNNGDQPLYVDYTLIGPGTFNIAVAPGSTDMVSMGPLTENQVIYLRTDPRKTTIVDLTTKPPTPQDLTAFQQAVKAFVDFASGGNAPPLMTEIESWFGIQPPQGNLYSLLQGRFGTLSAIPPMTAEGPTSAVVNASISDGASSSKLIAMCKPLRKYPL